VKIHPDDEVSTYRTHHHKVDTLNVTCVPAFIVASDVI